MNTINIFIISLLIAPVLVLAQNGTPLPNAGLTPESPFYFIDKLGEILREFFTFSPEGKARLQIEFAAERVAEIKIVLETKGVDAKGLEIAEARLREHLGEATEIVIRQKNKGKDVSALAKELKDDFEEPKSALADSFKSEKKALEAKEDELKAQLKAAVKAGDTAKAEALAQELGQVKAQLELLELKEEELEDDLDEEEEELEDEMDAREEAEEAIWEAEEEKAEMIEEAQEEGAEIPASVFEKFDRLLAQAKELFAKENHVGARQLAKQAKKSLKKIEDAIENLDEAQEEEEELKEEQEERAKEGAEEESERLEKEQKKAGEAIREAEEKLRDAGNNEEDE